MDKVQIYQELERRGELNKLPPEKQAVWAEYKRRQETPSAPALTPGQRAWNSFKQDIADITYAPRKALSGATLGATDWALRKLGVGYDDTENRMGEVSPLAKRLTKVGGFGAELGGNIGGLGGGLVKALAGKGLKGLKLGMASGGIEGLATGATSSDTLSELPKNVALGGLIGTGGGAVGEGLTYLARPFSARSLTKGMKGGLNNVVENPEAVKLLNQGIKQSDDVASEFLLKSRPVARGINKDTANMVDSALTSRVDIPEAIRSANEKYGKYMDEHGADQIYSMLSPEEQKAANFAKWNEGNKVVDEKGNPIKLFHGTSSKFDKFKKGNTFFVDNKDIAETYGSEDAVEAYLKMKNPYIVDAYGQSFGEIYNANGFKKAYKDLTDTDYQKIADEFFDGDVLEAKEWFPKTEQGEINLARAYGEKPKSTNEWADWAKGQGYDGVIIKDVNDTPDISNVRATDYVVFNPDQIKSVNNSGAWSSSPSLSDAGWTPEPYIGSLYEGLTEFQGKSLKNAMNTGFSKTNAKKGSLESLNKVKQEINEQIKKAQVTDKPSEVWQLQELKQKFDSAMPEGLKAVDKTYEKAKRLQDAFDRGTHYNPNNVDGADYISELSPLEQNAFAQGLFKRINNNSLTGKNLAKTALDYENTLASVLRGDKYDDLMKGLNKQSTKFERLAGLGRKAESKLNTPEAQRFFGREQLESKGSMIGSALDWLNTKFRHDALERAGKNLLNPNYVGDSEAWLIENYPIIAGYLSSKLNQEVNQ